MPTLPVAIDARGARVGATDFSKAQQKISRSAKTATRDVGRMNKATAAMGKTMGGAKMMIGGMVAGFGGLMMVRTITKTFMDFEDAMLGLKAVTGATGEQFQGLENRARELGATTRFSASEVAGSMRFLAMAGFSAEEAIAAVPATLDLAAAGMMDLASAGDLVSNVMKQFELNVGNTAHIADVLVTTANNANTSVSQLGEAMKMAGPMFQAVGISLEEMAAAAGALGDAGLQASMAGTNLRGVIAALLKPTDDASAMLGELGVNSEEVTNILARPGGLTQMFEQMGKHGLTAAQAVEIFGRRNAVAALIMAKSTDRMKELAEMNEKLEGSAKKAAEIMNSGLSGAFKTLKSAIDETMISMGKAGLSGGMRTMVEVITDTIKILGGMEGALDTASPAAKALATTLKGIGIALGVIVTVKIGAFLGIMTKGLIAATAAAVKLSWALARVVAIIAGPLMAFELGRWFTSEFKDVRGALIDLQAGFDTIWTSIVAGGQAAWELLAWSFEQMVFGIRKGLGALLETAESLATSMEDSVGGKLVGFDATSIQIAAANFTPGEAPDSLESRLNPIAEQWRKDLSVIGNANELLHKELDKEFKNRKRTSLSDFIIEDLDGSMKIIRDAIDKLTSSFERVPPEVKAVNEEFKALEDTAGKLAAAVGGVPDKTKDIADSAKDVSDAWSEAGNTISSAVGDLVFEFESLEETIAGVFESLARMALNKSLVEPLSGALSTGLKSAFSGLFSTSSTAPAFDVTAGGQTVAPLGAWAMDSASGNVVNNGNIIPFGKGGILNSSIAFPMRGGTGIAGESGPEGIVPLGRNSEGELGIKGGKNVTINFNISTPDADSFRRSGAQLRRDASKIARSF